MQCTVNEHSTTRTPGVRTMQKKTTYSHAIQESEELEQKNRRCDTRFKPALLMSQLSTATPPSTMGGMASQFQMSRVTKK
eukprot:m.607092 g.607092  ORF g.607092 m.607092 type:complete len:80 (-) comp58118_c1_seq5:714-953(-)